MRETAWLYRFLGHLSTYLRYLFTYLPVYEIPVRFIVLCPSLQHRSLLQAQCYYLASVIGIPVPEEQFHHIESH